MSKPDTPFPRHRLYYIALECVVIAGRGARSALPRVPNIVSSHQ